MRNALLILLTVSAALLVAGNNPVSPAQGAPVANQPVTVPPRASLTNQPTNNPIPPRASNTNWPVGTPIPPRASLTNQPVTIPPTKGASMTGRQSNDPPAPPLLLLPVNRDTTVRRCPLLRVEQYPGALPVYDFCVWQNGNKVAEHMTPLPVWLIVNGNSIFQAGAEYEWSCRVYVAHTWSAWFSPRWTFNIAWPGPVPTPLTPANGRRIPNLTPLLSILPSMLAQHYTFQITEPGSSFMLTKETRTPFWLVPRGAGMLEPGKTYNWTCRVDDGTGYSNWFRPTWSFVTYNPGEDAQARDGHNGLEFTCRAVPNPFGARTAISYTLPQSADVKISVFTPDGRTVREFAPGLQAAGSHQIVWNGTDKQNHPLTAGVYLCRVKAGNQERVERLIRTR